MSGSEEQVVTMRAAPVAWDSYDVGDVVRVYDSWGTAVARRALVRGKDDVNPDRRKVRVRYSDTKGVAWVAAERIIGAITGRSETLRTALDETDELARAGDVVGYESAYRILRRAVERALEERADVHTVPAGLMRHPDVT